MQREVTRRTLLRATGVAAVALSAPRLAMPGTVSAAEPAPRLTGWAHAATLVDRNERYDNNPYEDVLWTTLMRVDDKLGLPVPRWYLWFWTHDRPICRLYVADSPTGSFTPWDGVNGLCTFQGHDSLTNLTCRSAEPTPPPRKVYDANSNGYPDVDRLHFSSGDIAWDPATARFYATPHIARCGFSYQTTVLLTSLDGVSWTYVNSDTRIPMVQVGHPHSGRFDTYAADYGRFLRDYNGNLVRHEGKVVWFYRGTRKTSLGEQFELGAAVSDDFITWTKIDNPSKATRSLCNPNLGREFGLGSVLAVNGAFHIVWAMLESELGTPVVWMYIKESDDLFAWADEPGLLVYQPNPTMVDGGSYVIHDGIHYLSHRTITGVYNSPDSRARVDLARA